MVFAPLPPLPSLTATVCVNLSDSGGRNWAE